MSEPALAGVVLAGGSSRRMGTPKAALDWHGAPLLRRVCALLARVADPVVVVHAAGQPLPGLPAGVGTVADRRPERGPLEGMRAGFRALAGRRQAAFVCATDLPFLHPAFLRGLAARLDGYDAAVPVDGDHAHHLAAVYRIAILADIDALLDADRLRVGALVERVRSVRVPLGELPHPEAVHGLNDPAAVAAALRAPEPGVEVELPGRPPRAVRAATLARALAAVNEGRRGGYRVRLNGRRVPADPWLALADGDRLRLEAD